MTKQEGDPGRRMAMFQNGARPAHRHWIGDVVRPVLNHLQ